MNSAATGFLVLETGEIYQGVSVINASPDRAGEVVFNTSHSGYEEIATDPSYMNQIVLMTAPMQGNYGVDSSSWESNRIWIDGFICLQVASSLRDQSWIQRLRENSIPLLTEMDTRQITLRLRSGGTPWGAIITAENANEALKKAMALIEEKKKIEKDWVWLASRKEKEIRQGAKLQGPRIGVLDFGCKENILNELLSRSSELVIFPARAHLQELVDAKLDGLMLTNGPGDPSEVMHVQGVLKELIGRLPIFGICMGHQVLALALGARTFKMKFGHRGSNHPIKDELLGRVYMTSQNHGYAVDSETLPDHVKVTHVNLNDSSVAGYYSESKKCLGIQYHPESHPGPHDAVALFDYFIDRMIGKGKV